MDRVFRLEQLDRRVVGAPMAGGPTTPELVAAVSSAGGLGMLAAGYLSAEASLAEVHRVKELGCEVFGVNLFLTDRADSESAMEGRQRDLAAFVAELGQIARRYGVEVPVSPSFTDNDHAAKVDALVGCGVPVVSYTFGIPDAGEVERFRRAGTSVTVTVTDLDEARRALAVGADALCVQGFEAGGHRSTSSIGGRPNSVSTVDLVREVRAGCPGTQLIAAGGICGAAASARALDAGADAVQIGTALLRTREAGASGPHRSALVDPRFTETAVTRCFSGRPARSLVNAFVDRMDPLVPPAYPQVNTLTGPLRRASTAADDAESVNLWAGSRWRDAHPVGESVDGGIFGGSAVDVVAELWVAAGRLRDAAAGSPRGD